MLAMALRHPLIGIIGLTALIINPAVGCGSRDFVDEYTFGETEMLSAVQGTWRVTFSRPEGPSVVTFTLEKGVKPSGASNGGLAAPPGVGPQCGSRTFIRPAAACDSISALALEATIVEAEPPLDVAGGQGWFYVSGATYRGGHMELKIGADLQLEAYLDASNAVTQAWVKWQGVAGDSVLSRDGT